MSDQVNDAPLIWKCGSNVVALDVPQIMAIVNVTNDSFSGDGLGLSRDRALIQAEQALLDGAAIIDVGGESSRPGARPVSVQEEMDRVIPVVEDLVALGKPVSVDTIKPEIMRAAIAAGASIINDINALQTFGAVDAVSRSGVGVCLMHMQGEPGTMQQAPAYVDVVAEVAAHLGMRMDVLEAAGVDKRRIVLDPGIGFGKTLEHNLVLLRSLGRLRELGCPLLVGVSRKSMLGQITGRTVEKRLSASVVAAVLAIQRGASIIRVHDVAETRDAIAVWRALEENAN